MWLEMLLKLYLIGYNNKNFSNIIPDCIQKTKKKWEVLVGTKQTN